MSEPKEPRWLADLASVVPCNEPCCAFAMLRKMSERRTKSNEPYWELELGDTTAMVRGKVWARSEAFKAIADLPRRSAVKLMFEVGEYQGALQLDVKRMRAVQDDDAEHGYRPEVVFGEGWQRIRDLVCDTLVFDIETVPAVDRRKLPTTVAQSLTLSAQRREWDESKVMGMSPWFGKVVSLAIGDGDAPPGEQRVTVLAVPPPSREAGPWPDWLRPVSEPELLAAFWTLAAAADCVVSFNGRSFDVPFLVGRSLVHGVSAHADLLSGSRYAVRPHLDVCQALTGGERTIGPGSLEVVCWALGIQSPKGEMDGSMVATAYEKGQIERIAEYNAHDVRATTAVYQALRGQVLRFRGDW